MILECKDKKIFANYNPKSKKTYLKVTKYKYFGIPHPLLLRISRFFCKFAQK